MNRDEAISRRIQSAPASGPSTDWFFADRITSSTAANAQQAYAAAEQKRLGGEYQEAVRLYERVIAAAPGSTFAAQAQLQAADLYYEKLHDNARAAAGYRACLIDPMRQHLSPEAIQNAQVRLQEIEKQK